MKIPTKQGIITIQGNRAEAKKCYEQAIRESGEAMAIEEILNHDIEEKETAPEGETKKLQLDKEKRVNLGANMNPKIESEITAMLKNNVKTFAANASEIVGIDPQVITHDLNVAEAANPVKQKKRKFSEEKQKIIAEEVEKLEKAGFIREVHYPEWVANVVIVKKANGKNRMCVDYTDLNKACPKDSYPLPDIDQLGLYLFPFLK
ncbi:uncharacterized protein LOC126657205 [Mercurialis annua]|uniref:uncharacterized protein LOC126657205 n=1 Tax=Mercurialis annua TaxID=3986 RepID=UPI0021603DF4|nr:uncharacterized protein LOC126657205 [Mercurialis annua]